MSDVNFNEHRVFRETDSVIFYDISVEESNASDLVTVSYTHLTLPTKA